MQQSKSCFGFLHKQALTALLTVAGVVVAAPVHAESPTPTPLPKSGNLASSLTGGSNSGAPGTWGQDGPGEASSAPLAGSVSRSGNQWIARVFNNSTDEYSGDFKVVQMNARGGVARTDYFSVSLRGGQSSERSYSLANGGVNANLELTSWKKRSTPTKPSAAQADAGAEAHAASKGQVDDSADAAQ